MQAGTGCTQIAKGLKIPTQAHRPSAHTQAGHWEMLPWARFRVKAMLNEAPVPVPRARATLNTPPVASLQSSIQTAEGQLTCSFYITLQQVPKLLQGTWGQAAAAPGFPDL